ncbi:N-6 DNA methylase [Spiribacter aquaticus]|uniref:site-specific DNA-methyltransferase (adenine-specific) n=1 Tax=Spiribacter aquaticus TaxID=1935996 RepID=A0A557RJK5_9GAMM|nr:MULTISPECIES: type ISP restriction/modification enzyme [Spiribacter]KAF0280128.1 DNA methyltransferase [Spiribacter roseus]TVO65343.1 N-6 DNA methylase [Spiribacter aquaticus]
MSLISEFLSKVQSIYATGNATEPSYRSAFESLFAALGDDINALNEPQRVKCGAPDFMVTRGDIVIGHIEAKDLHVGLRDMKDANKKQQERYRAALSNLIYSNALDWDFYRNGELVASVTIADFVTGIEPNPDQFETLENLLKNFIAQRPQTITSPKELAERMAGKATLIKDVLSNTLREDENLQSELAAQYHAFKENLIHDITPEDFADIYAETIAYGMFAARLHDASLDTFSRQEALDLLPKSNPFLRSLFAYVAGYDLDDRIAWIIDDLARVFRACDVAKLMEGFGKLTGHNDPFLHFYETFLAAYSSSKRKARGVWYTPQPVVNFIVRAVDDVLQTEFGLPDGLADTSKVTIDWDVGQTDKKGKAVTIKKDVHRVQILDPATGTGTFLAEVIKQIAPTVQDVAPGMWSQFIEDDLIPRLHGFELLMASYAMCHMKLDMILNELGYNPKKAPPRLSVYLTNSLEEAEPANQSLPFTQWLSREAKGANTIKHDLPIMCVIGNPPYSGISQNMGSWITGLIDDYKYVDGKHFGERKHWLHDDYVKFIRLSERLMEENGEGVLGLITNHGYLDNPTFRGMRWHLLNTFDRIHILNLHGNTNRKEIGPDGEVDKNVFDIQQGVAIIIAVKTATKKQGLAEVCYGDLWGTREYKYKALGSEGFGDLITQKIASPAPQYPFVPRDISPIKAYWEGFDLTDFMPENTTGIVTMGDGFAIAETALQLNKKLTDFISTDHTESSLKEKYSLGKNYAKWILGNKSNLSTADLKPIPITYRPFDVKMTYFDNRILWRWRKRVMRNLVAADNFALIFSRQTVRSDAPPVNVLVSKHIFDNRGVYSNKGISQAAPLYLFPDGQDFDQTRRVNFDPKLYERLQELAKHPEHGTPDEVQVFDYIYGVLHSPAYRDTYAEFLKIDFPRIPWPTTPDEFWEVSCKGTELRKLHLMDPVTIGRTPYPFTTVDGTRGGNIVERPEFKYGKIWINETQYFSDVPEVSWVFYMGGYQPAQKWLKDRKGRTLSFDDIKHYQRILKILSETDRIMNENMVD